MQLFLSATSLHTAVQTVPLPSPPPCPSGPRQPLTPELSWFFFGLDVFSILTTTTKSLQLYHFVQAVARPRKAACSVEMVCGQCQQEEAGAVRETGRRTWAAASACQSSQSEKELRSVAGQWLLLHQLGLVLLAGAPFQWLDDLLRNVLIFLHFCVSLSPYVLLLLLILTAASCKIPQVWLNQRQCKM